jgi:hypothetical protein
LEQQDQEVPVKEQQGEETNGSFHEGDWSLNVEGLRKEKKSEGNLICI